MPLDKLVTWENIALCVEKHMSPDKIYGMPGLIEITFPGMKCSL